MQTEAIQLGEIIIHNIGNKNRDGVLELSERPMSVDQEQLQYLEGYLLKPFNELGELFRLSENEVGAQNPLQSICSEYFENGELTPTSQSIAKHIFNCTEQMSVKDGYLFVVELDEVVVDDVVTKGLGIFKAEQKVPFFRMEKTETQTELSVQQGFDQKKLDKGCIIVDDSAEDGYLVYTSEGRSADIGYWRNEFLGLEQRSNAYQYTTEVMSNCKKFVTKELSEEDGFDKAERANMLNRGLEYFKESETFDKEEFAEKVFESSTVASKFEDYTAEVAEAKGTEVVDNFEIDEAAIKKQQRIYKSVIKLDKNFHLYVHGGRDKIEKGYDDSRNESFYKIYFNEEN